MRASEKLLQATGIKVNPVDLPEIIFTAQRLADEVSSVKEKMAERRAYGSIPSSVPEENIIRNAKLCVVLDRWTAESDIDACAVQCWTSIQENYGCAACTAMSMMGERMLASACKVDIAGAVSMYALALVSGNESAVVDWNNNFGEDWGTCSVVHSSNYPKIFLNLIIEISNLDRIQPWRRREARDKRESFKGKMKL